MILPFPKERIVSKAQRSPRPREPKGPPDRPEALTNLLAFTPRPNAVPTRDARERDELAATVTEQLRALDVEARRLGPEWGNLLQDLAVSLRKESPIIVKLLNAYVEAIGFSEATAPALSAE